MSKLEIPESWAATTLGEIGTTMIGLTYSPADISEKGTPVLRSGNVQNSKIDFSDLVRVKKEIRPNLFITEGDILICARNGSKALVGKAAQVKTIAEPMTFGAFMAIYRSDFNAFVEKYIHSSLFRRQLDRVGTATINQITQNSLKGFSIPLPPLGEQKRIVSKIESTQEKINAIEQSVTKAEEQIVKYREALLQKAFRGDLVPQDPKDEPASKLLERIRADHAKQTDGRKKKKDDLSPIKPEEIPFKIPKSWEWVRLGRLEELGIIQLIEDGNHGELHPKAKDYSEKGICFIMANSLSDGALNLSSCKRLPKVITDKLRIGFSVAGDVLLTHKGTIGETAIVPEVDPYVMLTPQVTLYRLPKDGHLINEYLYRFFQSFWFQNKLSSISKQATRDYVGITKQKDLIIPFPPTGEQRRILIELTKGITWNERILTSVRTLIGLLTPLHCSLLSSAFSGRLVPQDLSEGTGHELLEKIKQSAQKEPVTKASRRTPFAKSKKKTRTKK